MLRRRPVASSLALLGLVAGLAACVQLDGLRAVTGEPEARPARAGERTTAVVAPRPEPPLDEAAAVAPPEPAGAVDGAAAAAAAAVAPPPAPTVDAVTAAPPTLPRKVLLLGDSVMHVAAPDIEAGFRAAGVEFVTHAFAGTSLLGGSDVTHTFAQRVAEERPDVVVLGYSGVYLPPYPTTADGAPVELASPAFWGLWRAKAEAATRDLAAHGARVYWVLNPHDRITWANRDTRMTDLYLGLRDAVPGTRFVDWRWAVAGAYGMPLDVVPIGPGGTLVPVRGDDGHHFSLEASAVLARELVAQVVAGG